MEKVVHLAFDILACLTVIGLIWRGIVSRINRKLLIEEKFQLTEQIRGTSKNLTFLAKTIPIELYKQVVREQRGQVMYTPCNRSHAILSMNNDRFDDCVHTMEPAAVFEMINKYFTRTVPYVQEKNGVLQSFDKAGFRALFYDKCEDALEAAVSISSFFNQEDKKEEIGEGFSLGISYGNVLTGFAGTEERKSLVTVSEAGELSSYLQSIARKYNSRLLITGTFRNRIDDFEKKFHARMIGYLYVSATQSLEEMYDVFDGDSMMMKNHKQKTKLAFERGVKEFAKGDYECARRYFIEVFKTNHFDAASKEYLYLCEKRLAMPKEAEWPVQIESF